MSVLFFMDSGLGGIPYLRRVRSSRPADRYIYLADRAGFPYGEKSPEYLMTRLNHIAACMIDLYNPDLMVLACNTASVTALGELRKNFDTPFVGVVPAVKPAAELKSGGTIGVLATDRTVAGEYLRALISEFAAGRSVETLGAPDLVDFVENTLYRADDEMVLKILKPYVDHIILNGWTTVVLGCTHFISLKPWLEKSLPAGVVVLDSTEGVGRRILDLAGEKNSDPNPGKGVFHITGTNFNTESYRHTAKMLDLEFSRLEDL